MRPVYEGGFTMTTRVEELDKVGRPQSILETVERITRKNGKEERQLVRAERDGKDVTEEMRERRGKQVAKKDDSGGQRNVSASAVSPFGQSEQPKYSFSLAGADPGNPGRLRIRFEPRGPASEKVNIGEALVEAAEAVPVRIRYRPAVYPKHIQKMEMELVYGARSALGPVLSTLSMEAQGGMLFIKKRFRSKTTFSDYRSGD